MPNITIEDGVDGGIIYDSWLNSADPNGPKGASPLLAMHELTPPQRIHELIYVSLVNYAGVTWINGKFILTPVATGGDVTFSVFASFGYAIFCYVFGRYWCKWKVHVAEAETSNIFNPFVGDLT